MPAAQLLRLGARLPLRGSVAGLRALGQAAEAAGLDALFVPDRPEDVLDADGALEAYTALGALAVSTTTVRLGALASELPGRPPALVAKQVTALDHLSGGRALLGLGVAAGARAGRAELRDALGVCRALFASVDAVSAGGRRHRVVGAVNRPGPLQDGGPAVVVELRPGDRPGVARAARHADVVVVAGFNRIVSRRRRQVLGAGRRPAVGSGPPWVLALVPAPDAGPTMAAAETDAVTAAVRSALDAGADGVVLDFPAGTRPQALVAVAEAAVAARR